MSKAKIDCQECGGTGLVPVVERVFGNEPHTADVGDKPCLCTIEEYFEDDDALTDLDEEFREQAIDACITLGLPEDEAELMVEDYEVI